jgi:hypothetical protein
MNKEDATKKKHKEAFKRILKMSIEKKKNK